VPGIRPCALTWLAGGARRGGDILPDLGAPSLGRTHCALPSPPWVDPGGGTAACSPRALRAPEVPPPWPRAVGPASPSLRSPVSSLSGAGAPRPGSYPSRARPRPRASPGARRLQGRARGPGGGAGGAPHVPGGPGRARGARAGAQEPREPPVPPPPFPGWRGSRHRHRFASGPRRGGSSSSSSSSRSGGPGECQARNNYKRKRRSEEEEEALFTFEKPSRRRSHKRRTLATRLPPRPVPAASRGPGVSAPRPGTAPRRPPPQNPPRGAAPIRPVPSRAGCCRPPARVTLGKSQQVGQRLRGARRGRSWPSRVEGETPAPGDAGSAPKVTAHQAVSRPLGRPGSCPCRSPGIRGS
jgi:hypothetical protein